MPWIAHYTHSPEDTAIGLGDTAEQAQAALLVAYPPAKGKLVGVVECAIGKGLPSLQDADGCISHL
jgi:hypothetical protein